MNKTEYQRIYYQKNKARHQADGRRRLLKNKLGITPEQVQELKIKQGLVCAICLKPEIQKFRGKIKELAIDHCHKSGKVRGLLCLKCNTLLGNAHDSQIILEAAIMYLKAALPTQSIKENP